MKKYRHGKITGILAITLALTFIMAACGASSSTPQHNSYDSVSENEQTIEQPSADYQYEDGGKGNGMSYDNMETTNPIWSLENGTADIEVDSATDERKVIKYSDMSLETKEFDESIEKLLAAISAAGGYVDSQNIGGKSLYSYNSYYQRSATINARIPTDKLDEISAAIPDICNVVSQSTSRQDITDSYYDIQARLETMQVREERLLTLLEQAQSLDDMITLEAALSDVRYEIESAQGQLRRMDNQVSYSYLNLYIDEVVEYTEIVDTPATFGERLKEAAKGAGQRLGDTLQNIVLFIVGDGPVILLWLIIIALIVFAVIAIIRKLKGSGSGENKKRKLLGKHKKQANDVLPVQKENEGEPK